MDTVSWHGMTGRLKLWSGINENFEKILPIVVFTSIFWYLFVK